jgi:hypothetical protein
VIRRERQSFLHFQDNKWVATGTSTKLNNQITRPSEFKMAIVVENNTFVVNKIVEGSYAKIITFQAPPELPPWAVDHIHVGLFVFPLTDVTNLRTEIDGPKNTN